MPGLRVLVRLPGLLWGGEGAGAALLFIVLSSLLGAAREVPKNIWLGYFHEKAFGMLKETFAQFAWDETKGTAIWVAAMALCFLGILGLARRSRWWWLWVGVPLALALLGSAALDPYRSKVYFKSHPLEDGELRQGITRLMEKAQIPFGDIRVDETGAKTAKLNAYFAGQGPTRTIVLWDSLIEKLTPREVMAAVAHEAGHADESRWGPWAMSAVVLVLFLAMVELLLRLTARRGWWGVTERADARAIPLIFFVYSLALFFYQPVSLARQREAELKADRFGLELTQDPEAFRSMLVKVGQASMIDPDPPRWVVLMASSHPPLSERVARVEAWKTPKAGRP